PLLGDNELPTKADAQAFELAIVEQEPALVKLVRDNRMRHERRELLLVPEQMTWQFDENTLTLSFSLPAGAFATAVVRELLDAREPEREFSHD
ncbi:tRNA pseudouridine(13) synthase TruD, partial [Photobacterium damselae subsp. damselae]|nr:tRNA pseudouridine(13) synthase TruD [Photobacterium damselae subsp. damselae]